MTADGKSLPKYARVAAAVRGQIADGTLRPGEPAPSGAALSRVTGYSTLTCRKALRQLIADGLLIPGPSRNARPRVVGPPQPAAERDLASAARALATGLAARRRANGLTQPELARRVGVSVTTVGHAETGRLWQSRQFWERADAVLDADGDLLGLHDAYREAGALASPGATATSETAAPGQAGPRDVPLPRGQAPAGTPAGHAPVQPVQPVQLGPLGPLGSLDQWWPGETHEADGVPTGSPGTLGPPAVQGQPVPTCVMIVWGDGTVTTVRPPEPA
jgi:DNA-binding transcriptional regulator YhcF (GntR family)